jgi:predicted phage baseplate assembly protein
VPILPPRLDDRGYRDLVAELLARIPAHTPEWTHPRPGDPGRTLLELFAWLGDTLLYRANLIPERQRLAFLSLLGLPLRPAVAARGLVAISLDGPEDAGLAPVLAPGTAVDGPVPFETTAELTVLPLEGRVHAKRPLTDDELAAPEMRELVEGLRRLYDLPARSRLAPYETVPLFADGGGGGGGADPAGFDLVTSTVDRRLWIALLAPEGLSAEAVREGLTGASDEGRRRLLSVGVVPALDLPAGLDALDPRAPVPHVWEVTTGETVGGEPRFDTVDPVSDSSGGLARTGVVRLALPASLGRPPSDLSGVGDDLAAGVGAQPPRLDDPELAERLVGWLSLRPTRRLETLRLSWVGLHAVEVDQRTTMSGVVVGQSHGQPDELFQLPRRSVEAASLVLQVEEGERGYQPWRRVDDLGLAGRDDRVFELDAEAGTVRLGDGLRGRLPAAGSRLRAARLRSGGGRAGNLPPGSLQAVGTPGPGSGHGAASARYRVLQPVATRGGEDAETLAEAERRIPAHLTHRERAVTEDDFRSLAAAAPGVRLGRVEVLSRFKPHERRSGVPGVVSVMVLPRKDVRERPAPRPDRPLVETVHGWLDPRRPLATELYVIGPEYRPLSLAVGVTVGDGHDREAVLQAVKETLRSHLWALAPGGLDGAGWPLGRSVRDRELEVVVARVVGVEAVAGVDLYVAPPRDGEAPGGAFELDPWKRLERQGDACAAVSLDLDLWELPELFGVTVSGDGEVPELTGVADPWSDEDGLPIGIPVVPEVC